MTVSVLHGDMLAILPTLAADSIEACVTDPPYELGFMSKRWDKTGVAFRPETWAEVLRVLKPGAHLLAFGAPRGWHRMACAIEDAGFEIRDDIANLHDGALGGPLMWAFASGFPKSHDVSKGIDKHGGLPVAWFGPWLRSWREQNGISQKEVAELFPSKSGGLTGCVANWELGLNMPTPDQFNAICVRFNLPFESLEVLAREVIGLRMTGIGTGQGTVSIMGDGKRDITAPATPEAAKWQGWGTSLKPAWEGITVARKPLAGTVAQNVLAHGTGALNIDATRIAGRERTEYGLASATRTKGAVYGDPSASADFDASKGRWPANLCHDGSAQVLDAFAAYGESSEKPRTLNRNGDRASEGWGLSAKSLGVVHGDSGTAARFFMSAKAGPEDRMDSKHPTIKPLALMRWLVRLVTPPGGTVLDPFAGSGTTGMAAMAEGFNAVLVEREAEYVADIRRRMAHVRGADTPLFAGVA